MSTSLGRLGDGRGRPPPLRLAYSAPGSASDDIPLHGPPSSKPVVSSLQSPTSPISPTMSVTARRMSGSNPPPATSHRGRRRTSATPPPDSLSAQAQRQALQDFAEACRAFFYNNDAVAEERMTRRLAALPAYDKRQYTKVQASIRAAFHRDAAARRRHEFRAHLTSTAPGGSLSPAARASPRGHEAALERSQRFAKFVETWCSPSFPGTSPFFDALWAVMTLQTLPNDLGGAGGRLLEWEVDDAVFQEAAGKAFMLDAIDILKGVLGFEPLGEPAVVSACPSPVPRGPQIRSTTTAAAAPAATPAPAPVATGRPRAISDPFIDATDDTPGLSHSLPSTVSSPRNPSALLPHQQYNSSPSTPPAELEPGDGESLFVPSAPHPEEGLGIILDDLVLEVPDDDDDQDESVRVWIAPDLTNYEYVSLLSALPTFVSSRKLPRLIAPEGAPARSKRRSAGGEPNDDVDLEAGELVKVEPPSVRHGTGVIRPGARERSPGWKSTWWRRLVSWCQRLFC
ncbi:hypothetical protein BKA62DRAFT_682519 [Auriculariales sp. MPI-PUGE-AT-0066]|nr:hypothetical protein BKA62DRAFT_682519 [Auriculariales sp. MPI-PUGE-AT-0066]